MDVKSIVIGTLGGLTLGFAIAWVSKPEPEQKQNIPSRPRESSDKPAERPTGPKPMYTGDDIDAARADERKKARESSDSELAKVQGEVQARDKKVAELEKNVGDLKKQVEELKKAPVNPDKPPAKKAPISWGKAGEIKEVGEADWADLANAMTEITKSLNEILLARKEGREPSPEAQKNIQKNNQKLIDYYVKVLRKLPTHLATNGEFMHPINTANLIAKALEAAGKPLSESQMKQVVTLGEEYEANWDRAQSSYNANTLKLEKVVDEAELKQKFYDDMVALLAPDQRDVIINPETHDYMQLDLYSPSLALMGNVAPIYKPTLEEVRTVLVAECARDWGLNKDVFGAQGFVLDNWFADCATMLDPRTQAELGLLKTQECIKYGRAQIKAVKAMIEQLHPDEKQLALIRDDAQIAILRVLKPQ